MRVWLGPLRGEKMTLRLSVSICLALVLPGCAALEPMANFWTVDEALAVPPEEIAPSELERSVAPTAPAAVPPPAAVPVAQPPRPKPKPTDLERDPPSAKPKPTDLERDPPSAKLERVFGLSLGETRALLGTPYLQREAPPAKVLAYDGKSCTLSVFFYLDLDSDRYRALAYEIKGGDGSEPAKQRCLSDIFAGGSVAPPIDHLEAARFQLSSTHSQMFP